MSTTATGATGTDPVLLAAEAQADSTLDALYAQVLQLAVQKQLTATSDFVPLVTIVINIVEQATSNQSLSDVEKKLLTIHLMQRLVADIPTTQLSDGARTFINSAINDLLPSLIDALISASNSQLFHTLETDVVTEVKAVETKLKSKGCNCFGK